MKRILTTASLIIYINLVAQAQKNIVSNLGEIIPSTTVGHNLLITPNQSFVRFIKINADNTVTPRTSSEMLSDIDAQVNIRNKFINWAQSGGGTTISATGVVITATGTATSVAQATTNYYTITPRLEYLVTTAATTAVAGWRSGAAIFNMGTTSSNGGLLYSTEWGNATGAATSTTRCFVGIQSSTAAPTDVEPSTLLNIFGVGWDAADANIQFMHNDESGAATKIDLGSNFPVPVTDRSVGYKLEMTTVSNSSSVNYTLTNTITLSTATGTVNTNLPLNSIFLGSRGYMSVGGTSSVIGIALKKSYIQSPLTN